MDVEGSTAACFKFLFFIGTAEGGNLKLSAASNSVCFLNTVDIAITNTPSSKIASNQPFASPVTLRLTKQTASDSDTSGLTLLVAVVSSLNRAALTNKYFGAQSFLENNVCIFNNNAIVAGGCSSISVLNNGASGSYIAETTFTSLAYSRIENVDLVLRFATPFQYASQFIDSARLTVAVQAENLEFVEQPPASLKINELFQVRVEASLSNGTPLGFVEVFANITAASTVSSFTDSIFSYAANLQTTINNLNQLSASNNIRLSQEGASALTNAEGIATLSLKIVGGTSGNYSIVVSSGQNVQSSPSNIFLYSNDVGAVSSLSDIA